VLPIKATWHRLIKKVSEARRNSRDRVREA
jgi:hypothetical protein